MLSRWALESYLKDYVGTALFLYSKMAELGYEVAQSNAAWILDMYVKQSMCMGKYELCTDAKRHQRAHSLWWPRKHGCDSRAATPAPDTRRHADSHSIHQFAFFSSSFFPICASSGQFVPIQAESR